MSVQEFEKQMFKQLMQPNKDKKLKLSTSSLYCTKPLVVGSASRQTIRIMNRYKAKEIAEKIKAVELIQMFVNAQNNIKDWKQVSNINPIMTKGTCFNILTKCKITDETHILAKINMIREFGEFLPNYEKEIKAKKELPTPVHQEPIFITIN